MSIAAILPFVLSSGFLPQPVADFSCPAAPRASLSVEFINTPPVYDHEKSSAYLGLYDTDTTFSRGAHEHFSVGGLTVGKVRNTYDVQYGMLASPAEDSFCIWVTGVQVRVHYEPEVFIASRHARGSCRYHVIAEHELRHVNTDILTLRAFLPQIETGLRATLAQMTVYGPYDVPARDRAIEGLSAVIRQQMEDYTAAFDRLRHERQQQIDTRQEYLRIGQACPK